jgi:subtilisin family serine protease
MRGKVLLPLFTALLFLFAPDSPGQSAKYWVYFTDKGIKSSQYLNSSSAQYDIQNISEYITPKALARRGKVRDKDHLLDESDLPLHEHYIQKIIECGAILVQKSRWLNAASFIITPEINKKIISLPFVSKIEPVKVLKGRLENSIVAESALSLCKGAIYDYGISYNQLNMSNIIQLHDARITGRGVLIGMLDSGYRWKLHEALQSRHVLAEYDFIFKDNNTANEQNDPEIEDSHGTATFSVLGSYKPGYLIGAAFDADFLLAKTEYDSTEFQTEEDYWAAGIEWLEGMGADIVSSSLGYDLFDDGTGYFWENGDFNGQTSITSRAATRAARLGVVVCTSMGNEGNGDGVMGTMTTPADADSIISVGAVQFNGRLAVFSSTGPTNDDRIKPDVVAPGVNIYHARVPGPDTYGYSQGTSFSTPLTAGAAALLLSVRPDLTPIEVRDALRSSAAPIDTGASRPVPNNFTGWGLIDAFNTAASVGPVFSNKPFVDLSAGEIFLSTFVFSKNGVNPDSTILFFSVGTDPSWKNIRMTLDSAVKFPTSGRYAALLPAMQSGTPVRFYITARDSTNRSYTSPSQIYFPYWTYYYGSENVNETPQLPTDFVLEQNFPNPFNSGTWIQYSIPRKEHASLKVYNIIGQLVAVLLDGSREVGGSFPEIAYFDAGRLPSGVYFYRLTTPTFSSTKKMLHIR